MISGQAGILAAIVIYLLAMVGSRSRAAGTAEIYREYRRKPTMF